MSVDLLSIGAKITSVACLLGFALACAAPDKTVITYKEEILELRGNIEHDIVVGIPGWELEARERAIHLANLLGKIDENKLHTAKKVIQHEYRGWALLIAADTFGAKPQINKQQADDAMGAIEEFDKALDRMADITRAYQAGKPEATELYIWITGPSDDLNRTHYLKAAALAVVALAGGERTKADARHELTAINPAFFEKQPAANHPALAWALQD
jgi:hypothetical protein